MVINGQTLILKLEDRTIHLSRSLSIPLSPKDINHTRSIKPGTVWEAKVLNYFPKTQKLFLMITNGEATGQGFSVNQENIFSTLAVKEVRFKSIPTNTLLKSTTKKEGAQNQYPIPETDIPEVQTPPIPSGSKEEIYESEDWNTLENYVAQLDEEEESESAPPESIEIQDATELPVIQQQIKLIESTFSVRIKSLRFCDGFVQFVRYIKELEREIEFKVFNDAIRKEYDAIKNYFANSLKLKKIDAQVKITYTIPDLEVRECTANSSDIDKIDSSIIEGVKFNFIKKTFISAGEDDDSDQVMFTLEDLYDSYTDKDVSPEIFHNTPEELFEDFLRIKKPKHYQHLQYLSKRHVRKVLNLRFILKPFSFVFLLANETSYFIIWETLNTKEATYIWEVFPKEKERLKQEIANIDNTIGQIKDEGKKAFLQTKPENFCRIFHDYLHGEDGFEKWKAGLKNKLEG